MATEEPTPTINEEDLPLSEFFKRGNDADAGKEPAPLPPVEKPAESVKAAEAEKEVAAAEPEKDGDERNADGTFKPKKNRRDDPRTAVQAAVAKQREAERRAEDAERRLADRDRQPAAEPVKEPKKDTPEYKRYQGMTDAPKLADFEEYTDYTAALSLFIADKRFEERMAQREEAQHVQSVRGKWFERLNAAKAADPDLLSKIKSDTPTTPQLDDFVMRSELGVDILKYLSDHQDLAQRLLTLHPLSVAEELGKLEGSLKGTQAAVARPGPAPVKISQAQPPIKPVEGSPPVSGADVDEADLPLSEFIRRGNKQDRTRLGH